MSIYFLFMTFLNFIRKCVSYVARWYKKIEMFDKLNHCEAGTGVLLYPEARISNYQGKRGSVRIGQNSHILGELTVFAHGGIINVGESCYVGENSRIWSAQSIRIGDRVQISHNVNIHDTNAHSLSAANRFLHQCAILNEGHPSQLDDVAAAPIVIEDDAWIGFNATILKGVTIGRGAVVGAASVVTKDVAPFAVVVGNPARVVGTARP
jgi:maltose O-acetyltransferase